MATTIKRNVRTYTDFSIGFDVNPFTRDINIKKDEEAVKASIKNLLLTRNYERPFHPEIGSPISALLFENFTPILKNTLEKIIEDLLIKFEPRARIISIDVTDNPDENSLDIRVEFMMNNIDRPITVTSTLRRIR
jgi:phage baseplate assembly protein W